MGAGTDGEQQCPGLQGSTKQPMKTGRDHRSCGTTCATGSAENTFQAGKARDQVLEAQGGRRWTQEQAYGFRWYHLCPKATHLDISSSHIATQAESRSALLGGGQSQTWLGNEPSFPAVGLTSLRVGEPEQMKSVTLLRKGSLGLGNTHVEPGSRASCAVTKHRDQQGLQAVEQFLTLGSRAQLHTQQA